MQPHLSVRKADRTSPVFGLLRFTPAEWRHLIEDPSFLRDADNSYAVPRRLIGLTVVIVPDHRFS